MFLILDTFNKWYSLFNEVNDKALMIIKIGMLLFIS